MKKFLIILPCFLISIASFAQSNTATDKAPGYVKDPNIPNFTVYKAPDSTVFTNNNLEKNKPTLLMIFSPECGHCQNETKELEKYIDHFKNVQILMVTWLPYSEMMAFYDNYKIASYPNIIMGWDKKDFFLPYYHVQMYPDMVVYDKHGKYVNSFSGMIKLQDVVDALNK